MSERPLRVLLVDDEASLREPLAKYLERSYGYHVDTAACSTEAMTRVTAHQNQYDVVLIDYVLAVTPDQEPEPIGVQLLTEIKAHSPQTECILFTGWDLDVALEALRAGAFRYIRKPFDHLELGPMIEHAAEYHRLKGEAREKQILAQLMATGTALHGEHNLQEVLNIVLRGVQAIGFDRVRLYLLAADGQYLDGCAQVGMDETFVGLKRPMAADPYMQRLFADPRPQIFTRQPGEPIPYERPLAKENVYEWICVPLLFQGKIIGKLSADNKFSQRPLVAGELGALALFAAQAAAAIENARLMAQTQATTAQAHQSARTLASLQEVSRAISALVDPDAILRAACKAVVELFEVSHSGLVRFASDYKQGIVVAEYPAWGAIGLEIPVAGVSPEERLVSEQIPVMLADVAKEATLGPVREILVKLKVCSILVVPVVAKGQVLASFSLDVVEGPRIFTAAEVELCQTFAAQVAVALENARLFSETNRHAEHLEQLRQTTLAITSQLDQDALLKNIIQQAVALLGAKSGGIYAYAPERSELTVITDYGRSHLLGKTLKVGEGMAGRLVQTNESFMIVDDYNQWADKAPLYSTIQPFGAVIEVPLRWQEQIIGVLYVDDTVGRRFTAEDAELLRLFADHAAIALNNAQLMGQLAEQKDQQARLIASSPTAVIAIDNAGIVTSFNEQAQKILNYQAVEVLGKPVIPLYADPEEPRKIGRLLYEAPTGQLSNYLSAVCSKAGEHIPISLSATWLYDAQRNQIGSVGYFEDLRAIQETEKRLELLLSASNVVAQAKNLTNGLQRLIDLLVTFLGVSFGGIELLDETGQYLAVEAAFPADTGLLDWNPRIGDQTAVNDWTGLLQFLNQSEPYILRLDNERQRSQLLDIAHQHQLSQAIQSMLFIPLRTRQRIVGLLFLGELRPWDQAPLSQPKVDLVTAIAAQTTILIDRIRLHERTERRRQFLTALDESSRHIRAEKEPTKLLQEVVRLAAELVNCSAGGLYIYRPHIGEVELQVTYHLPELLADPVRTQLETLIREVAQTSQPKLWRQPSAAGDGEMQGFRLLMGIPLKQAGETEAVLFVADDTPARSFTVFDQEVLGRFAGQAAIALQTSRLLGQEQRALAKLAILHQISDYIQAAVDLDKILHVVLTGVTAGYGLGFNRAALFLLDERHEHLVGQMGIGYLDEALAREDWENNQQNGLYDFHVYLAQLEQNALPFTPLGQRVVGVSIPLQNINPDIFSHTIQEQHYHLVQAGELATLPPRFQTAFEPASPLIIVPLTARQHTIGLLVADNKFTHTAITSEDADVLLTFANTAAIAIDNLRLRHETEVARERLRAYYTASNALVSSQNTDHVLATIAEQARVTANAAWVCILLISETGTVRKLITAGFDKDLYAETVMRPQGLSMQVMRTGQPEIIEDTSQQAERVHPNILRDQVGAALCLPLAARGQRIGVMWFHYAQARHFPQAELDALQLYVNQAVLAYDSAQRMAELDHMRRAADALAGAADLREVLNQIVESAQAVLQADSTVVWSYDASADRFILEESVAAGIPKTIWEEFRKTGPRLRGTAATVMAQGWVGVTDVADGQQYEFLGESTRKLLESVSAKSFQGVALTVDQENLGVLYVNYNHLRTFSANERQIAQTFANHAALALKKAKLLEQVNKARNAARAVAEVTVLENLQSTLAALVQRTHEALNCDVITLYTYDEARQQFGFPPAMLGVRQPERVLALGQVLARSVLYNILALSQLHVAEDTPNDPLLRGRFALEEGILSSLGMPLIAGEHKVGVLFVNYRRRHQFTGDELANVQLFAYQAAVAIRNAQLYESVQKRAAILEALYNAGRAITDSLDLTEILQRIAEQVTHLTSEADKAVGFTDITLLEAHKANFVAVYPQEALQKIKEALSDGVDLTHGIGPDKRVGIVGRAITTGQLQLVADVSQDAEYLMSHPETRSELVVPIKLGNDVIGAINVEQPSLNAFDQEHCAALESLAAQASIAIRNAQLYAQERRQVAALNALHKASRAITSSLELPEILANIAEQALALTDAHHKKALCCDIVLVEGQQLVLAAGYPADNLRELTITATTIDLEHDSRIGIVGRAVRTKAPQLVANVTQDPDYIPHNAETRSELAIPIKVGQAVIGVISVEHPDYNGFDETDLLVLEALTAQAAIAIQNARQYDELKQTKGVVGARTALAWMGMANNAWRHSIEGHAINIRNAITLIRRKGTLDESLIVKLNDIERFTNQILEKPITPPLSSEEGAELVIVNDLIAERINQLWKYEWYQQVKSELDLRPEANVGVWVSPEWLRRALDLLIDNAVQAMVNSPQPKLRITTQCVQRNLEILIADTGPGIPPELQTKLFRERIEHPKGSRGMGMGLLMVQAIVQAYQGDIRLQATSPYGTIMVVSLPLIQNQHS